MILYNASTSKGLRNFTRFLTNTNSTTYTDADLDASLNMYYQLFVTEMLQAMDGWDFQADTATADLVANQQEYPFPGDMLKIKEIQVTYDGTNWYRAKSFDISERYSATDTTSINRDFNASEPFYDLMDESIMLYPIPSGNVTAGIKIWYEKEAEELVNATDQPNLPEAFQKGLCYGAAKDYMEKHSGTEETAGRWQGKWQIMKANFEEILERAKNHYSTREQEQEYFITNINQGYDSEYGNY